jgi:hypothetical protein
MKMKNLLNRETKYECSDEGCPVSRGSLEDGLDNIAEYLGLDPGNTLFLHTTVVNDNRVSRKLAYKPSFAHSEILSYSSKRVENQARGACLYVNSGLLEYFDDTGISPSSNTIKINTVPDVDKYPYLSVSAHFKDHLLRNPVLVASLNGYTIVTSFLSQDDVEIAELLGGRLIMDPSRQSDFNSKYHFRRMGEEYGFSIPPGISFKGLENLEENVVTLKDRLACLGTTNSAGIWLKFESQTSGEGSMRIDGLNNNSVNILRNHIFEFSKSIEVDKEETNQFLPLVLELDVSSIPMEREIANIGVQAVIGEGGITLVGATSQISKNGKYIGSTVNRTTEYLLEYAEQTAVPAFAAMHSEGYRGYMTIDVLLVKNDGTGEIKGYNIDPNARFTAGTPLLSLLQHSMKLSGRKLYGFSYSNAVRADEDVFDRIKDYSGKFLYRGASSNFMGIIPIVLNDKKNIAENKYYLRTVVISDSIEGAEKMYSEFKKRLIADLQ